jgi:hypothetical protein
MIIHQILLLKTSGNIVEMLAALEEAGGTARTLLLTERGFLGLGPPSLEVGEEIWALLEPRFHKLY